MVTYNRSVESISFCKYYRTRGQSQKRVRARKKTCYVLLFERRIGRNLRAGLTGGRLAPRPAPHRSYVRRSAGAVAAHCDSGSRRCNTALLHPGVSISCPSVATRYTQWAVAASSEQRASQISRGAV